MSNPATLAPAPSPNIELRNFHHAAFASEETECFDAEVWVDGKFSFFARNEGTGGCHTYVPPTYDNKGHATMRAAMERLEAHCKTLPPDEVHGTKIEFDVDYLLATLVEAKIVGRVVDGFMRKLKDRHYVVEDGNLLESKRLTPQRMTTSAMQAWAAKNPGKRLVNLLPPTEQRALFERVVRKEPLS